MYANTPTDILPHTPCMIPTAHVKKTHKKHVHTHDKDTRRDVKHVKEAAS